jgi:hypothetical protein
MHRSTDAARAASEAGIAIPQPRYWSGGIGRRQSGRGAMTVAPIATQKGRGKDGSPVEVLSSRRQSHGKVDEMSVGG